MIMNVVKFIITYYAFIYVKTVSLDIPVQVQLTFFFSC